MAAVVASFGSGPYQALNSQIRKRLMRSKPLKVTDMVNGAVGGPPVPKVSFLAFIRKAITTKSLLSINRLKSILVKSDGSLDRRVMIKLTRKLGLETSI